MNTPTCACARPSPDAYLCTHCAGELVTALHTIKTLAGELDITIARLSRTSEGDGGRHTAVHPLPFDWAASDVAYAVQNTVGSWARHVAETRGVDIAMDSPTIGAVAAWLTGHVEWIRHRQESSEMLDEITYAARTLRHAVDRRAPRWYAGTCDQCGTDLYVRPGIVLITCRQCRCPYDAAQRREWLLDVAVDTLAHAELIGRALTALGAPVTPSQIRNWAGRGRLPRHGVDHRGRPLYRVGDVIELARERVAARATRQDKVTA